VNAVERPGVKLLPCRFQTIPVGYRVPGS